MSNNDFYGNIVLHVCGVTDSEYGMCGVREQVSDFFFFFLLDLLRNFPNIRETRQGQKHKIHRQNKHTK